MPSPWRPGVKYETRVEHTAKILAASPSPPVRVLSKLELVIVTSTTHGTVLSTRCRDEIALLAINPPAAYFSFGKVIREMFRDIEDPKMRMFEKGSPLLIAVGFMDVSCRLCGIRGPSDHLSSQDWLDLDAPVTSIPTLPEVMDHVRELSSNGRNKQRPTIIRNMPRQKATPSWVDFPLNRLAIPPRCGKVV